MSHERADQLVEAGLWLKLSGDLDGAKRLFEQALRLDPSNARAQQLLDARPAAGDSSDGPPGSPPPASNIPPAQSVIEQDWAMATGMLVERGMTPPPIPPLNRPSSGGTAPGERAPSTGVWGNVPWESEEAAPQNKVESAWDKAAQPPEPVASGAGMGRAMDLIATPVPSFTPPPGTLSKQKVEDEVRTLLKGARDLLELDDHTGAIDLILKAQELAPMDPEVVRMREKSEQTLQAMFESKLGSMEKHPRVALKNEDIIWLNLDHRAGFVLAQIDGSVSFEDLFSVSGMSRLDTARILVQLMDQGVIKT